MTFIEVLDPATFEPVQGGKIGTLVVTPLGTDNVTPFELCRGTDVSGIAERLARQFKEKFEIAAAIVVLETGTLAKEFEANIKAARFVDRRG